MGNSKSNAPNAKLALQIFIKKFKLPNPRLKFHLFFQRYPNTVEVLKAAPGTMADIGAGAQIIATGPLASDGTVKATAIRVTAAAASGDIGQDGAAVVVTTQTGGICMSAHEREPR